MKKGFVILLTLISAALVGFIPIKADEITTNYEDINVVTPVLSEQQIKKYDTALYLTEYLREGGYVDFSHINNDYTLDDFVDDFTSSLDSLITGQRYSTKELMAMESTINLTNLGLDIFTNIYRNNLISYDDNSTTPIPTPPSDYSYISNDVDFIPFNSGVLGGINFISSDLACSLSYPSPGYPSYLDSSNKSNYTYYNNSEFYGNIFYLSSIVNINIVSDENNTFVTYGNFTPQYLYYNTQNVYGAVITDQYVQSNYKYFRMFQQYTTYPNYSPTSTFNDLNQAITYIHNHFRHYNLTVNGIPWVNVNNPTNYYVSLGNGTFIEGTNTPIEWKYDEDIYIDIQDILDRLETLIQNQNKISFPDFSDLIVDENGQQAVAVKIVNDKDNIDDAIVKEYGTLIPIFPVYVTYPISVEDVSNIATIGITDVIPDDIMQVCFIALLGMLFVTFIHRNLE